MTIRRRSRLGAALLATLMLTSGCALRLQSFAGAGGADGETYRVSAVFDELTRLPIGGAVRVGQRDVGAVTAIETRDFHAIVHMTIQADTELPVNTRAELRLTSALGEQQVVLRAPGSSGEVLTDGAVIGASRTSAGPDVEQTLAVLGTLVNGAGLAQARTVLNEVTTALDGRAGKVPELLAQLDSALGTLADNRAAITSLIDSLHRLSGTLAGNKSTLEDALTRIEPAIEVLLTQKDEFLGLLGKVNSLAKTASGLLERTSGALVGTVRDLRPVLDDLRGIDGRLGSILTKLDRFADLMHQAVPGDYLLLDGTLDVPLTVAELLSPDLSGAQPDTGGIRELLRGGVR